MYIIVSSVVDFFKMGHKKQAFWPQINIFKVNTINKKSFWKIGHDLEIKCYQKKKYVILNKKCAHKLFF